MIRGLRNGRRGLSVLGAIVLLQALTVAALAYYLAAGTGNGKAGVNTLSAPTITAATPGAGTVALTWSAVTPPDTGTVTYNVTRNGGTPGGNCPTSAAPTSVTTCTDSGLTAGTYQYTVTAHWRTWTATSSIRSVTVASGAATQLTLSAAQTSVTAGQADNLTITAKDASGNTVTAYTGSKSLTFTGAGTVGANSPTVTDSGGTARTFGTAETINFTNGVASVSGASNGVMTLYKAETANVVVSDGSINNGSGLAVTVGATGASKLAFTQQPGNSTGGVALATQPQVAVQDQYGNTVTGNTSSVTVAIGTNPGGGTLSCTTNPLAASAGVASFAGCKIDKAGTGYTLTATDGTLTSATSSAFNITVGPAAKLAFTQPPGNSTGGIALATQPKVAVQDAGGNTVTTDTSSVTLAIGTNPGGGTLTCTTNPLTASAGVATFAGCKIDKSGTGYTLTATDGSLTSATSGTFNITVGPAAKLAFTQTPTGGVLGVAFATQPRVTVQDAGGNTVTTDTSSVTLAIGTNPGGGTLTCTSNPVTASAGVATFAGCKISKAGNGYTLTATDGTLTSATSATFNVNASPIWVANGATTTWTSNIAQSVALPASLSVNDYELMIVVNTAANVSTAPTGWTSVTTVSSALGQGIAISVFSKFFQTGDTAPSVTVNADAGGASAMIAAFRFVNTTTPLDIAAVTSTSLAGASTFTPTGVTTLTANDRGESLVAENNGASTAPTLSFSTSQSFTMETGFPMTPAVGNSTNHHAVALAGKALPTIGVTTFPTYSTTASGIWAGVSLGLRP